MIPDDIQTGALVEHLKTGESYRFVRWGSATDICSHTRPVTVRREKEGALSVCFPAAELWAPQ